MVHTGRPIATLTGSSDATMSERASSGALWNFLMLMKNIKNNLRLKTLAEILIKVIKIFHIKVHLLNIQIPVLIEAIVVVVVVGPAASCSHTKFHTI